MVKDLTFQALKLLSQYLSTLKPEGDLYKMTSCVNPEEAEIIGYLIAIGDLIEKEDMDTADFLRTDLAQFIEKIGIAKWQRGELTALGLRVGLRHQESVDLAHDVTSTDEAGIMDNAEQ